MQTAGVEVSGALFYPSKNHSKLNGKAFQPEAQYGRVMVNPCYRIAPLASGVQALCDSGAFQDIDAQRRLPVEEALRRQLAFETLISPSSSWHFEAIAIYDQMLGVDEVLVGGKKVKRRGDKESGRRAVAETLKAAAYYATQRDQIRGRIMFVGQGVNPDQYIDDCLTPMLDLMRPGDYFALGGFCIIGKVPSLKPLFVQTLARALPLLKKRGIKRVHLLGVTVPDMVALASQMCRAERLTLSLDSSSLEVNSVLGKVFVGGKWVKVYSKEDKFINYHPNDLAHRNILAYHEWCATLRNAPPPTIRQLPFAM